MTKITQDPMGLILGNCFVYQGANSFVVRFIPSIYFYLLPVMLGSIQIRFQYLNPLYVHSFIQLNFVKNFYSRGNTQIKEVESFLGVNFIRSVIAFGCNHSYSCLDIFFIKINFLIV